MGVPMTAPDEKDVPLRDRPCPYCGALSGPARIRHHVVACSETYPQGACSRLCRRRNFVPHVHIRCGTCDGWWKAPAIREEEILAGEHLA